MITVTELIAQLSKLPGDLPVVMSKDGEGNSASPFAEATSQGYIQRQTWWGDIADDSEGEQAVVLWPVN